MPSTHHRMVNGLVALAKISSLNGADRQAIIDLAEQNQDPQDSLSELLEEICEGARPIPREPTTPDERFVCALTRFIEKVISYQDPEWDVADQARIGLVDPLDFEFVPVEAATGEETSADDTSAGDDTGSADTLSGSEGADTIAGAEDEDALEPPAQTEPQTMSENSEADVVVMNTGGVDGSPPGKPPKKVPKDA